MPRSRVSVLPRVGARMIEARGIFPGAEVVRGCDWMQDGNETTYSLTVNFYTSFLDSMLLGSSGYSII